MCNASSTTQRVGRPRVPLAEPTGVAEALVGEALSRCAEQMGLEDAAAVMDRLRRGDPVAHQAYEQELARHVAEYLSYLDSDIQAVYRYECACGGHRDGQHPPEMRPTVHLVVLTRRRTAALISVLAALDRALTQSLADGCGLNDAAPVLNVFVIDDDELRHREGYAGLLFPPHLEPVSIGQP